MKAVRSQPHREIRKICDRFKKRKINKVEALKEINRVRLNLGLQELDELPKCWRVIK